MAYTFDASAQFTEEYRKVCRKNAPFQRMLDVKVRQILDHLESMPDHYEPLRNELAGIRRVRIGSFVVFFRIHEEIRTVKFLRIDHHDSAYK